ncbi:hypothetical protein H2204_001936 [Knufia peltigerae]|nr:hypothetical protein H2204_001936 [Knufia peltigerae]
MSAPSSIVAAHVNPKDPRLLRRQVLHNASKSTSSASPEKNKSPDVRDGNIPETRVTAAPPPGFSSSDRGTALMPMLCNIIDGRLLSRKREAVERSLQQHGDAYEHTQRTYSEFPLMVRQAAQNLKHAQEKFEAAQKAEEAHLAAAEPENILRILVHEPAKQSSEFEAQRAELNDLRQKLNAMQTQISSESKKSDATATELAKVTAELTKVSAENDDLKKRTLDQESTIKTLTARVKGLESSYGEHAKTMEGNVKTVRCEMEASFKATETKILGFEEYRKSIQLMVMVVKGDLGAAVDRISSIEKNVGSVQDIKLRHGEVENLRKELDQLQESCEARAKAADATKDQVESLNNSTDAQSERIAKLFRQITDQQSEIQALSTNVDLFKSEISESLVDHQASTLTSVSKKIEDRIEQQNVEFDLVKASNDRQEMEIKRLGEDLTTSLRQAKEVKRIEEDLTTSLRRGLKEAGESLKASLDNAISVERIENELKSKITALEKEVLEIRNSPHPASQASTANDSSSAAIITRVQELETNAKKVQDAITLVGHNFRWLDHRFNNLETSQLRQSILKAVIPQLPQIEQGLVNIANLDNMMSKLQGELEQVRSDLETRSKKIKEELDTMMAKTSETQSAQLRLYTDTSQMKETISGLMINQQNDEGNYERTTTRRARSARLDRGQGESQPRSRSSRAYGDVDSADELNPESSDPTHSALLEQFRATATKSIHSTDARSPVPSSPLRGRDVRLGKRKYSEIDSPSRNDRRA